MTGWVGYGNADAYTGTGVKLIFNNCKFGGFWSQSSHELITCEFNNCSFRSTALSNAVYNNCYLGGESETDTVSSSDIAAPGENVTFNDCYFADIVAKTDEQGDAHLDGVQSLTPRNQYFNNCRWEVPDINYSAKQGGFSYAIFLQSDNVENCIFDHCHINGGGYHTISVTDTTPVNCRIIEPFIGYCYYGAPFYPADGGNYTNSSEAVTENARLHDSLYVSSVWKEDGKLHFLVTNDTGEDRTLSVYANENLETFTIPRTWKLTEYDVDTKNFDDLPIDIEHEIAVDAEYAVFYDTTESVASDENQIRYVNYGANSVYRKSNGDHVTQAPAQRLITETYRDTAIIPDKYNTGVPTGVVLMDVPVNPDGEVLGTVTSDDGGTAPKIAYRSDTDSLVINFYSNRNLAAESVIEGYNFTSNFTTLEIHQYDSPKKIIFNNCRFKSFTHDIRQASSLVFEFNNCTFNGELGISNAVLNNCYFGESNGKDGIKPYENVTINNCFMANLLNNPSLDNGHIDGIQVIGYSASGHNIADIVVNNTRFALPIFYFDGTNTSYTNAAILCGPSEVETNGVMFNDIIVDMGGQYTPFYSTYDEGYAIENVTFKDIVVTDMYQNNNSLFYSGIYNEDTVVDNVRCESMLYVSSVWKDDEGKTHIICTNNSTLGDRTLKVVTNLGEYEFTIDRSPTQSELLNDATYQTYTYDNMPYDVECIIDEDVDYVVCYDTEEAEENQIRFMNWSGNPVYATNSNSQGSGNDGDSIFTQPGTGSAVVELTVTSTYSVRIPKKITLDGSNKEGSYTVSVCGDIPADENVSVVPTSTLEMKQTGKDNVTATVTQDKTVWAANELTADEYTTTTGVINAEGLTAGEWSGVLVFNISITSE